MNTIKKLHTLFLILGLLLISKSASAKWEFPIPSAKTYGFSIPTPFPTIADNNFFSSIQPILGWQTMYKNQDVINRVILGIDKSITTTYYAAFSVNVDVMVTMTDENNIITNQMRRLRVTYDPANNKIENNISIYEFTGALRISLQVMGIFDDAGAPLPSAPVNVYLQPFIQVNRIQIFNTALVPVIPTLSFIPGEYEERTISITQLPGAESYDVEWVFIDRYTSESAILPYEKVKYDFRHNGSRMNVKETNVKIPMIYNRGIILMRIRAKGITNLSNVDVYDDGNWSLPESGDLYINFSSPSTVYSTIFPFTQATTAFYFDGYQNHLNWQRQASFAEDGKQKQVISYFDGILRDRQSITKNNTEGLPIVGQKIYDFFGRPAIEVLPIPDADNLTMRYRVGFNTTASPGHAGQSYSYKDFDIDAVNACIGSKTSRMDTMRGASKYYSTNNSLNPAVVNKSLIPHAQTYPFVQTEFTPDNTGRVRRQGGVGLTHRLTGENDLGLIQNGHETKYFYNSPSQTELDRLFANEVGDAIHYKKHITVDANGQQSVSYLDPQGRVIATALIGNPNNSPNMIPLDNVDTRTITDDLLEKNKVSATSRSISTSHTFYVSDDGQQRIFDYTFTAPKLIEECLPPNFCFDCIYKMELSIINTDCGEEYVPLDDREKVVGTIDSICGTDIVFSTSDVLYTFFLPKGNYMVKKTLTVDDNALQYYKDVFVRNNQCIKTYEDFLEEERNKIDFDNCYYSCEKCNEDLQDLITANGWALDDEAYLLAKQGCDEICEVKTPCFALYEMIKIDMSPGGQYFNNVNNTTRVVDPNAVDPFKIDGSYSSNYDWLNANITPTQRDMIFADIYTNFGVTVTSWAELEENWDPDFAQYLAPYHPEYCYFQECKNIESSYLYDEDMLSTDEWNDAKTKGYYNPIGTNLTSFDLDYKTDYIINQKDPFFEMVYNATRKTNMDNDLTEYFSDPGYIDPENSAWKAMELAMAQLGLKSCFNNYSWAAFRGMYLGLKQKYYKDYYESTCTVTIASNFTRRFIFDNGQAKTAGGNDPRFDNLTESNPTTVSNNITAEVATHCNDVCTDYADSWMNKLKNCVYVLPVTETIIKNHLIDICKLGCDIDNHFGSRDIAPTATYQFKNFKEVLVYYGIYVEGICDDLLIGWPMNYGHDYMAELSPESDACACSTNKNIKNIHCPITGPAKDTCLCNGSSATSLGQKALIGANVESEYKCKNCIDCYTINEHLRKFFAIYPSSWAYLNEGQFNELITNYLNINLSMNLDFADYAIFASKCLNQEAQGYDSTSFYRLSRFKFIYRPASSYSASYTLIESVFPSDIRIAESGNINNKPIYTLDHSDKSTWLASVYNASYENDNYLLQIPKVKSHGPNANSTPRFITRKFERNDNITSTSKMAALDCNCEEIMRAHALWKTGKLRASSAQMAYQVLTGYTFADYDSKLAQCCYIYNHIPPMSGPLPPVPPPCSFDEEAYLNQLQNGVPPVFNTAGYNLPVQADFADEPCPDDETECHNQKVTLDRCACEYLMILRDKLGGANFDNPGAYTEQDLRNLIEKEFGLPPNSLPPDFNPREMTGWCQEFFSSGAGDDPGGNPYDYNVITNPTPPPTKTIDWDAHGAKNTGLDDLNETAYDEELEVPRILSCHPYCAREVFPGGGGPGGGGVYPPVVILPEPPKCKFAGCDKLIELYKEFLDSMGIPHGGPGDPPLLPEEFQGEYEFRKLVLDFQALKSTSTFAPVAAWAGYFPGGTTTKDIFDKINASMTTKLLADGYCNIESDRPFKDPGETFNYMLRLLYCLNPIHYSVTECSACVQSNDTLEKIQAWFNRLAKDDLEILHKNNQWYKHPAKPLAWVPQFYDEFYAGFNPANIKQEIWTAKIPMLRYTITEGGQIFDIFLMLPNTADKYNWRYLKYFYDIEMVLDKDCAPTNMFKIKSRLELAKRYRKDNPNCPVLANPCDEEVEMYGYVFDPVNLITSNVTPIPCPPCSTLCNRPFLIKQDTTDPCLRVLDDIAESNAQYRYQEYIKDVLDSFEKRYIAKCLKPIEAFTMQYSDFEYHYTLYYYDQSDNLIKTVPPAAVVPITNPTKLQNIKDYRAGTNPTREYPLHNKDLITNYKYNTLKKLIEQKTPDGGTAHFWYDKLGRLVLSQNAKQNAVPPVNGDLLYSYTEFDELGRINEVGEILLDPANITPFNVADNIGTLLVSAQTTKEQVTRTIYDNPSVTYSGSMHPGFVQQNTRNRVVHSIYMEVWNAGNNNFNHATHYNYDMLGNVNQVVQDFPELDQYGSRYKLVEYRYDLVSGNTNMVMYQPTPNNGSLPFPDRFYHYYEYDADNRLKAAYTSKRPAVEYMDFRQNRPDISTSTGWTRDAKYFYFPHGPLSRYEIGEEKVQGVDYAYTIHGWMKSFNSGVTKQQYDPGRDGDNTIVGSNRWVGRDAFGLELSHYANDYISIAPMQNISSKISSDIGNNNVELFNGNISQTITSIPDITSWQLGILAPDVSAQLYRYDQLNRLKTSRYYNNVNVPGNSWFMSGPIPDQYRMELNYDPNGNITHLTRNGNNATLAMDELDYNYIAGTNQLEYVTDMVNSANYSVDIDLQSANNYDYDEIGNLIKDDAEEIQNIEWTVYGKIKKITRTGSSLKPDLEFEYNSIGQRIVKKVIPKNTTDGPIIDYYILDASGNTLTVYRSKDIETLPYRTRDFYKTEIPLYGGTKRVGVIDDSTLMAEITYTPLPGGGENILTSNVLNYAASIDSFSIIYGYKKYELTNHLGNVQATVTDRKLAITTATAIDWYNPDIVTITDYYAFGMEIVDKHWIANTSYRYGLNGMEKTDEVYGNGNEYSTEFRQLDVRLCRWMSLDPMMAKYPGLSPYIAFNNNPIFFTDPFGNDPPEGFTTEKGIGGTDLVLPPGAIITRHKDTDGDGKIELPVGPKGAMVVTNAKPGEVAKFTIGKTEYKRQYDESGNFTGYFDASGNKYENPDITVASGGFSGTDLANMQVTFNVSNVPAGGIQIIQPLVYSGLTPAAQASNSSMSFNTDGLITGQYYFSNGGVKFAGEVDGAKGSFYSYQNGGMPANAAGPYYNSPSDLANPGYANMTWNGTSGSITAYDGVSARVEQKVMTFRTIIVAVNYMGTGQDVVLGVYEWGWDNYGTTPVHGAAVSLKGNTVSTQDINIIQHYYPTYNFLK